MLSAQLRPAGLTTKRSDVPSCLCGGVLNVNHLCSKQYMCACNSSNVTIDTNLFVYVRILRLGHSVFSKNLIFGRFFLNFIIKKKSNENCIAI